MRFRQIRIAVCALACLAVAPVASMGQATQRGKAQVSIYNGDPAASTGMVIGAWGSGEARESEDKVYIGSKSIKITTHGRYQGGRLGFGTPLNLKSVLDDKASYIQFMFVLPSKDTLGRMGSDYGGFGRMMSGRGPGGGGPGGKGGEGGAGSMMGEGAQKLVKPKPLSTIRMVLVTTDDKHIETALPLDSARKTETDWSSLSLPLAALPALKNTSGEIKEVQFFGNSPGILYLGEARIVHDETPIRVDDIPEMTIALNDTVTFTASAEGGLSTLKYEWDFDDADGVDVDAEGRVVKHKFRKSKRDAAGNSVPYIVTLRVSDVHGLKKPTKTSTKVTVTL